MLLAIACASTLTPDHSGPRWQDAYAVAMQSGSSEIDIWPFGWQMPNFSRPPGKPNDQVKLVTLDTASLGARGQFTLQSYDAHALSNTDGRTLRLTISASVPQKTIQILYVITPDAPVSSSLAAEPSGRWTAMLQFDTPKRAQQASAALCLAAGMSDGQIRLLMPVGAACANSVRGN